MSKMIEQALRLANETAIEHSKHYYRCAHFGGVIFNDNEILDIISSDVDNHAEINALLSVQNECLKQRFERGEYSL
jgi:pyrimidine deaminase RibD-like protein